MLVLGKLAASLDEAQVKLERAIASGAAAEAFQQMVSALGGPSDLMQNPEKHLKAAPIIRTVPAPRPGFVVAVDTRAIGIAVVELGGGRARAQDLIDHAVGFSSLAGLGNEVGEKPGSGRPLAIIHARDEASLARAAARLTGAYTIAEAAPPGAPAAMRERITS